MDARIYAMIDDLSRRACTELVPSFPGDRLSFLRDKIRSEYEHGALSADGISFAWTNDDAAA